MGQRFAFGAALVAALFLFSRNSRAHGMTSGKLTEYGGDDEIPDLEGIVSDEVGFYFPDEFVGPLYGGIDMSSPEQRYSAFLYMIRSTEHVWPRDVINDRAYQIFYGGSVFTNLSDHPVLTGEKKGVPLSPEMCRNAGFSSGKCVSTAAGAYQIILPTWQRVRRAGNWGGRLDDFGPASQDEAARRILIEIGALPFVLYGDVEKAIKLASGQWASLPGSRAKQGAKSIDFALARFSEGGPDGVA